MREPVTGNRWITERWRVIGVVAGDSPGTNAQERTVVHSGPDGTRYLWPGLQLRLYKHEAESYYRNLLGQAPAVYVVCQVDESGELVPMEATVDYVEAGARREAGDEVFPVDMPPEIYRWLEAYVVEHYAPEEPKKGRKRPEGRRGGPRSHEPND